MSQWTHVNGNIRFDYLRNLGLPAVDWDEALGRTCNYDSSEGDWEKCTVPKGSEGSIQFTIHENPDPSCMAAYSVSVHGDLRDFGLQEVPKIEEWFEKTVVLKDILGRPGIRNAILEIGVEFGPTIVLVYVDDSEGTLNSERKSRVQRYEISRENRVNEKA